MKLSTVASTALTLVLAPLVRGQLQPQTNTFGSSFELTDAQTSSLDLSDIQANDLTIAVRFEQTNWATGSVFNDPFYTSLPSTAKTAAAGSVLKVEEFTIPTNYTIAPALSLSRIVYQSKSLNGSLVPVSAYILWPFNNRYENSRAPLVSWGHGTSGLFAECAPSHIRNLWNQFSAPFELALSGFAVVAPDFAGLGVPRNADGRPIVHEYLASPAAGNDLLYAAQAAYAAFPKKVTKDFVVMGHSQGGGAAWAAAQQQVKAKVPGYMGAIPVAPVTSALELSRAVGSSLGLLQIAKALPSIMPNVSISDMLTAKGIAFVSLLEEIQGCASSTELLVAHLLGADPSLVLTKDTFIESPAAYKWDELTVAGGKEFRGPMLVIQGNEDRTVSAQITAEFAKQTCKKYPKESLQYLAVDGVGHTPVLYAAQQHWLAWLDERFGKKNSWLNYHSKGKCYSETIGKNTPMPLNQYTGNLNYFISFALSPYTV